MWFFLEKREIKDKKREEKLKGQFISPNFSEQQPKNTQGSYCNNPKTNLYNRR